MRFVVLSDTHSQELPQQVLAEIKNSDGIIHVGDFCDVDVVRALQQIKELKSVYGNMDGLDVRALMPRQMVFQCEGAMIGLTHGEGGPEKFLDRVRAIFKNEKVDAIVFGHSHTAMNEVVDGVLLFNPGSPTDTVRAAFRSYGVLEVKAGKVKGKIVKIK